MDCIKIFKQSIDFQQTAVEQLRNKEEMPHLKTRAREPVELPKHCIAIDHKTRKLNPLFDRYVSRRRLNIEMLMIKGCKIARVGSFMNRLIIPVFNGGAVVAFQGADMTGKAELKYKSEGDINDYLYNYDNIGKKMIVTEGILDAWRMGEDAVATFGTSLTDEQRLLIRQKNLKELWFCWDADAYTKAKNEAGNFINFIEDVRVARLPKGEDP
ncbi:MAG: hypothetical protein ACTSRU_17720, partial [Candidatus Hodarchaeales archaeon]